MLLLRLICCYRMILKYGNSCKTQYKTTTKYSGFSHGFLPSLCYDTVGWTAGRAFGL